MSRIGKQIAEAAFGSLELIAQLAADALGADQHKTKLIVEVIKSIAETVREGRAREISPEQVAEKIEASLKTLEDTIAADRKDARAAVDAFRAPTPA